ncbi:energy-coupling factor transporter transmembrane component T family protein [[Eubacterium] cellulosolvens]
MKFLYQYSASNSFLHRLDPRTKMIFILCYLVVALIWPGYQLMIFTTLFAIFLLWCAAGISPKEYWQFLAYLAPIMIALILVQSLAGGPPFIEIPLGPFVIPISEPGFFLGLGIGLRLATMGIAFMIFAMTTDPFDISLALHKTGVAFKISFLVGFMLRFLPLIQEELFTIADASKARAYKAMDSKNPASILRAIVAAMPPLAAGALRRSQNIALAMELRGFSFPTEFGIKRTFLKDIQMKRADYLTIAASLSYAIFGLTLFFTTQQFDVMGYATGLTVFLVFPALALMILYVLYKRAAKREEQEKKKKLQVQPQQ